MVEAAQINGYPTLLLFPGLGADSSLFTLQSLAFPNLVTPDWLQPLPNEDVDDYLARWIKQLEDSGKIDRQSPLIVGGASFGGLIAQRAATLLKTNDCILLGSIKESSEAPKRIRWLRPVHRLAFRWLIRFWQTVIRVGLFCGGRLLSRRARLVLSHFSRLDAGLVRWSICQLYHCLDKADERAQSNDHEVEQAFQIHQIHGTADRVFPLRKLAKRSDTRIYSIEGGGHLFTVFAAEQVNATLKQILDEVSKANGAPGSTGSENKLLNDPPVENHDSTGQSQPID